MGGLGSARASEVLVVGAGVVGLSVAAHLRWLGVPVIVLERERTGGGTSTRGFGTVAAQSRPPGHPLRLHLAALDYYPEFVARLGCADAYRVSGSISLIRTEAELAARRGLIVGQGRDDGYDPGQILDAAALRSIEPALGDAFGWGQYRAADGHGEPGRLLDGLRRAATDAGAELVEGAAVQGVRMIGDTWQADTAVGRFEARVLVNCAGVWAGALARSAGLSLPVQSVRGQIVVLAARPPMLKATISWHGRTDIRQGDDGRVWLGTVEQSGSWDLRVRANDTREIVERAVEAVPSLDDGVIAEAWAALRPVPTDGLPLVGQLAGAPGYFVAVGHGGLSLCGVEGRGLAAQIAGSDVDPLLATFDPNRAMPELALHASASAISERVLARLTVDGMRTEATDWAQVGTYVARSEEATAKLARAVDEQPLRATPPRTP
ncbi:FAD-dependent oxidoreductase [soil metagenome]